MGEVAKDPANREGVLTYAVPTTLIAGSTLFAIYLGICRLVLDDTEVTTRTLFILGVAETIIQPLVLLCAAEHHGLGRIARSQALAILPLLLRLVTAAVIFGTDFIEPLQNYAWGYSLSSLLALWLALLTLPAPWPKHRAWRLPNRLELGQMVGFAAVSFTKAGPSEIDKTLAANLLPLSAAGLYASAARVIGAMTLPITAMTLSALPRLFRDSQNHENQNQSRLLAQWMFGAAVGYGTALAVTLWTAAPLFEMIFGMNYQGLTQMIQFLCIAIPGMAARLVAGNVLMGQRPWARVGFEATGLLTLLVTSAVLTTRFGAHGMPAALAISEWTMAIIGYTLVFTKKDIHQ